MVFCIFGCSAYENSKENFDSSPSSALEENKPTDNELIEESEYPKILSDEELNDFKVFYSLSVWQNTDGPQVPHSVLYEDDNKIIQLQIHSYKDKEVADYGPDCDILLFALYYGSYSAYNIESIEMIDESTYKINVKNLGIKFQDFEDYYLENCTFIIYDPVADDDVFELSIPEIDLAETMYKKPFIKGAY